MDKDMLNYKLIKIYERLSHEQVMHSRRNRDWDKFDQLDETGKLIQKFEELEIYSDLFEDNREEDFE